MLSSRVLAALVVVLPSAIACAPAPCEFLTDCPGALVCSRDGACVESDAPEVVGGGGPTTLGPRADPNDLLEARLDVTGGFAGNIGGTEFETTSPVVEGGSEGYVAYQLTTTAVDGSGVGMWFDIPVPSLLAAGEPRTFTLEQMMSDGTIPCISLWNGDGNSAWAEDYIITVYPEDEVGTAMIEIDATTTDSEVVATITVPALI